MYLFVNLLYACRFVMPSGPLTVNVRSWPCMRIVAVFIIIAVPLNHGIFRGLALDLALTSPARTYPDSPSLNHEGPGEFFVGWR